MDKQECLEILNQKIDKTQEETDRSPEGSSYGTLMLGRKQAFSDVRGLLKTLDEPEKPEIPHWLAEWIENREIDSKDSLVWQIYKKWSYPSFSTEQLKWLSNGDNRVTAVRAIFNGYTIEKEPVWVVKINKKLYFCRFTDKYFKENSDEPTYIESGNPSLIKKFTDKAKAEAVATLINGEVEEWSE